MLYEDQDNINIPGVDQQLLRALNDKIKQDPHYPIPEGYMKVTEQMPVDEYKIPADIAVMLQESKVISIETLDSILN